MSEERTYCVINKKPMEVLLERISWAKRSSYNMLYKSFLERMLDNNKEREECFRQGIDAYFDEKEGGPLGTIECPISEADDDEVFHAFVYGVLRQLDYDFNHKISSIFKLKGDLTYFSNMITLPPEITKQMREFDSELAERYGSCIFIDMQEPEAEEENITDEFTFDIEDVFYANGDLVRTYTDLATNRILVIDQESERYSIYHRHVSAVVSHGHANKIRIVKRSF